MITARTLAAPLLLLLAITGCSEQERPAPPPTSTSEQIADVVVHELKEETWQGTVKTFGVIEALEEVNVAAELSGTVKAVHVNEGDRVEAGQLLLELDPEKRQFLLQQANQQVKKARTALEAARLKLQRRRELAENETISKEILDNALLAVDSTTAAYQQAIASQHLARRELSDTRIFSPTAGLVDIKAVEAGEPVVAGASLITLQVVQTLRMHTWVSEADILHIRAGGKALITASGISGRQYRAQIAWVGVNADPQTGNFPVKLILSDNINALRPGMTASALLDGIAVPNTLLLPEAALIDRNRRRVVFIVEQGVAHLREPSLAAGFSNRLHILGGLSAGDKVIIQGQEQLQDGASVNIRGDH